jgi:outer membrane protein assembly factor BamB
MVSAGGILFTIEDHATTEDVNAPVEYRLVARDAFNGIQLWHLPMKHWGEWQTNSIKSISTQQQRLLAAVGDTVFTVLESDGPVVALDAKTGKEQRRFPNTEQTAEFVIDGAMFYGIKSTAHKLPKSKGSAATPGVELYALKIQQGTLLWTKTINSGYTGGTITAKGNRLLYHSSSGLTLMDNSTGRDLWTETIKVADAPEPKTGNNRRAKSPADLSIFTANEHPTIVLTEDSVYCGISKFITAMNSEDGTTRWTAVGSTNYMKSPDLFVIDGMVWGRDLQGRDTKTGEIIRPLKQEMNGPMSHDRCYRNRITHRYYLNSASGGTDFVKFDGTAETPNPWARSTCGLAVMPANGMIYNGPYVCQCAIGAMVTGVNGFYNGSGDTDKRFTVTIEPRVIKGRAFGAASGEASSAEDWPSYRGSGTRGGFTTSSTPTTVALKWKSNIGARPTAPVVSADSVYVADQTGHTLHALDRTTGKKRWSFVSEGGIDSPPTYHKGLILVGSRGGWVYCLRATDGEMVWKFTGMPERRLVCDSGRLESAWPISGSILVFEDTAYFAAGRSTFLDGGIGVFGLDPATGAMKHGRMLSGPYQDEKRNFPVPASGTFQLEGCKADIFSTAKNELFVRQQAFKADLQPIKPDDVQSIHIMASAGFLNDSPQHRTYWTVDRDLRYGGSMGSFGSGPAGDIVAFDGNTFYEVRGYAPGRNLEGRGKGMKPAEIYSVHSGRLKDTSGKEDRDAIPGFGRWEKRWNTPTPFAGHAVAASANTVLVAGMPMLPSYTPEDTNASYAGKKGGIAWLIDANDGRQLQEISFDAAPVWDGIAIAHQSFFVCLNDGSVICLGGPSL